MKWLLALALALAPLPARADCACQTDDAGDCSGLVTCDADTFNALAHALIDTEHTRDRCLSANTALAQKLLSAEQALLEPRVPSWMPWVAGGAGVVLTLAVVALVR